MSYALQVNKHTAPELLKSWRSNSKAHPVDLYIKDRRVVHMRNWLIKVPCRLTDQLQFLIMQFLVNCLIMQFLVNCLVLPARGVL